MRSAMPADAAVLPFGVAPARARCAYPERPICLVVPFAFVARERDRCREVVTLSGARVE